MKSPLWSARMDRTESQRYSRKGAPCCSIHARALRSRLVEQLEEVVHPSARPRPLDGDGLQGHLCRKGSQGRGGEHRAGELLASELLVGGGPSTLQEVVPAVTQLGSHPPQTHGLRDGDVGIHSAIVLHPASLEGRSREQQPTGDLNPPARLDCPCHMSRMRPEEEGRNGTWTWTRWEATAGPVTDDGSIIEGGWVEEW